jgi:hypothetical protein
MNSTQRRLPFAPRWLEQGRGQPAHSRVAATTLRRGWTRIGIDWNEAIRIVRILPSNAWMRVVRRSGLDSDDGLFQQGSFGPQNTIQAVVRILGRHRPEPDTTIMESVSLRRRGERAPARTDAIELGSAPALECGGWRLANHFSSASLAAPLSDVERCGTSRRGRRLAHAKARMLPGINCVVPADAQIVSFIRNP